MAFSRELSNYRQYSGVGDAVQSQTVAQVKSILEKAQTDIRQSNKGVISQADKEQALIARLSDEQASLVLLSETTIPGHRLAVIEERISSYISTWQSYIMRDTERIADRLDTYNRYRVAVIALQAILVILSLVLIAYTYVSPAFERLLHRLMIQNKRLRESDAYKSEFVSLVSHQLRTPLSELKWTLTLLESENDAKHQQHLVRQAKQSTGSLIDLVTTLLNLTRLEQGRLVFVPATVPLIPLIQQCCRQLRPQLKERRIILRTQFPEKPIIVQADPLLLKQAVQNVLENAAHYNTAAGRILVTVVPRTHDYLIEISDTGVGMAESERLQLFTKFYRAESGKRQRPNGSGLGLYFVKKIINTHRGRVWVKSRLGKGTTVGIVLPKE